MEPPASPAAATFSPDDAPAYRLPAVIDPMTLRRYFTLHLADREEVGRCRGAANTLGFAIQLCTLRWRGHFLRDMAGVPAAVEALAEQVGLLPLALAASLQGYPGSGDTRLDHHERLRRHLGFSRCGVPERQRLLDHMTITARSVPRAATLYPLACRWLLEQRVVRPGVSTIRDLLTRAREQALAAMFEALTSGYRFLPVVVHTCAGATKCTRALELQTRTQNLRCDSKLKSYSIGYGVFLPKMHTLPYAQANRGMAAMDIKIGARINLGSAKSPDFATIQSVVGKTAIVRCDDDVVMRLSLELVERFTLATARLNAQPRRRKSATGTSSAPQSGQASAS